MGNPYVGRPATAFWRKSVAGVHPDDVDPVVSPVFSLSQSDKVATAGSCFAQHIAKTLVQNNFRYLVTEDGPPERTFGVFPARFGNLYSARQLLQLFERAYDVFDPADDIWHLKNGRFVDPFRPRSEPDGFTTPSELRADRRDHLAAVRLMFETADVFIFTLGLTEAWEAVEDGAVVPLAPGVSGEPSAATYRFVNFSVCDMRRDMERFISLVRLVNPELRILLTVSPVPLIATYETRHVMVSTVYSKSALRVVADEICRSFPNVDYFPSYEIITGPHNRGKYFAEDLREVTSEGVSAVMNLFKRHYLKSELHAGRKEDLTGYIDSEQMQRLEQLARVICEEESIDPLSAT